MPWRSLRWSRPSSTRVYWRRLNVSVTSTCARVGVGLEVDQTVKTYVKLSKKHVEEKLRRIHPYFNEEK